MVTDVTNFETEVIQASKERPILVDFWAPWCGPCRFLGPVLEKLAQEPDANWSLAKVNTDEQTAVAQRYRISSIPAVKLFVDGEVADEFIGALPEPQVLQWLAKAVPSETKKRFEGAVQLIAAGERDEARAQLEDIVASDPTSDAARIQLARLAAFEDLEKTQLLLKDVSSAEATPIRLAVDALARMTTLDEAALADSPAKAPYLNAAVALRDGDYDTAIARLVDAVRVDRPYDNDGARLAALAVFTLLGDQHPSTVRGRRALQMALF